VLAASVETLTPRLFEALRRLAGGTPSLVLTGRRARALGLAGVTDDPQAVIVPADLDLARLKALAGTEAGRSKPPDPSAGARDAAGLSAQATGELADAALRLTKHARLLPAVLVAPETGGAESSHLLSVAAAAVRDFQLPGAVDLQRVSEARVPLAGHEDCRLVVFRDTRDGTEHVAVLVGAVNPADTVEVRVHSSCLTGDLLGSLRCDCGDQLRSAIDRFATLGGGVLLYMQQEGRGIGLANKMRAYNLQDAGLDTLDADQHLGFEPDERTYLAAAAMLRDLDIRRIRLHSNNPQKMQALRDTGVEVVALRTLAGEVNPHNARYIRVKQQRAGHLLPEADGTTKK
jgi:GTP cyclohydrolase II